jgi:hypothetical protein
VLLNETLQRMRIEKDILEDIAGFAPDEGDWRALDDLLLELWAAPPTRAALPVLFGVFERFPGDDGAGVFWSIVHGVEHAFPEYEPELRDSLARSASEMGAIMLRRSVKAESRTTPLE